MAGPDPPGLVGVPKTAARQALGAIGEASQVVEAALQARTAASEDQRFATTKTLFFALSSLGGALMLELRLKTLGQGKPTSEVRLDCDACVSALQGVLASKKVEMTHPFCRSVAHCFRQAFELCDSLNAVGAVLDLHKLLDNKKAPPDSKIATLEALGQVAQAAGLRVVSVLPESVAAAAKHLKQSEALVRAKAVCTLRDLIEGAGGVGSSVHGEALKAAIKAAADKCPEVRLEAYKLCLALAEAAPNLAAPSSPVPVETLVALCVKGLDDESPASRLAAAAATGAALAKGAEGSAAENERLGVIAARDQEREDGDEGSGGGGGRGSSISLSAKTLNFSKLKLKEMSIEMKVGLPKMVEKKMPPLGESLTPETVVQFLSELFRRATFPSLQSREYMAGVAEAFVCLWKRPYMLQRVNSSTVSKLVGTVLDLLDTDRLPQGAGETSVVRTAVEYMVREGISAPLPELAQQLIAREMLQILAEVAGSAPPASGFPPLMNEHQIQVCLVELSHLTRALGQACAALKDTMAASLSALLAHPSYGVRFEAAVALASLGSALPWCAAGLLQQCLDEIQQQYDALMADGILPASASALTPTLTAPLNPSGGLELGAESSTVEVPPGGEGGEADPDLELDGDGEGQGQGGRVPSGGSSSPAVKEEDKVDVDASADVASSGGGGVVGSAKVAARAGMSRGRSTVATKRMRLLLLHGNSAAASLLLQVARELPMGIPSKVAENSFSAAEKLILVQFPDPPSQPLRAAGTSSSDEESAKGDDSAGALGKSGSVRTASEHPMGVVCSCVRTGWSLMSSLFCVGEEWAEGKADRLCQLWAVCIRGAEDGSGAVRLRGLEAAHELILLDASTRALLWFLRSCPNTLCMVPRRLSLAVSLMESTVEAVEGRLKSPSKKQGIICRTLLKALLMECFAWLPPGTFPSSNARLFKWSLDHLKMYTLNDVQSSLLPELLNPDDAVLSVSSTAKVPGMLGVGSLVEGEDSDRVLAQVALVSGVTIGPQERDAMVCSAEVWAGRGPSPARRRRELETLPPTPMHAAAQSHGSSDELFSAAGRRGLGGWRRPLASSASINVRLLDAAVQVFAASFGQQSDASKLDGVLGLVQALPENLQAAAAAAAASAAGAAAARASVPAATSAAAAAAAAGAPRGGKKEPPSFTMPGLMSEDDRKKRDKRHRLSVLNVCTAMLAAFKSMSPLHQGEERGSASPPRHNIDLPWVTLARDVLMELLAWDDSMARRAAAETLALMGLKIGDGYAVYLIQDLSKILRKRPDKKKMSDRDVMGGALVNANRRAGAMFTLACLKRTLAGQVVLNWFWGDVQRELSVGGDVLQPARTWGLHSISLLVKGIEEEINPTQYSEVQDVVKYLWSIVELLEAHFLDSWLPSSLLSSKRSSASSSTSSGSTIFGKEGQAVAADLPGLASVLAKLLCTLLPVLQGLEPSRAMVRRFMAMWGVLRHYDDCRVTHGCLELVELLAMFAPGDVADNLPEVMPFLQGVLAGGVGGTSPECLLQAAMCVKLISARVPEVIEEYQPELELYCCLESVLGSLTWEGAPTWRGVVVSRDVERHFGVRVEAARQIEVAIDTAASVDQAGYRPLHWLLFGKALVVGTGHVQRPTSAYSASDGEGYHHGDPGSRGAFGDSRIASSDWSDVVQAARNALARFASPLASSRWQVKRSAVRGCVMVLAGLQGGSSPQTDDRISCLDVSKARRMVNRAIRSKSVSRSPIGSATGAGALSRSLPLWALVPPLLCLYLEDLVTTACAAATASTDDSELLELQEAGIMMLTEVVRTFAQVPDSDAHEQGVIVVVGGKNVRVASLALELSISQITGAVRPALGCKVSPRLAQRGCELVLTLVREGLVKDTVVLRRLIRQVMPEEILAVATKISGFERSRRRSRSSRTPSPPPRNLASRSPSASTIPSEENASALGFRNKRGKEVDGLVLGGTGSAHGSHKSLEGGQEDLKFSVKHAVEESYRPQESELYGAHVPLLERAARLQCLAVLSLVAGGEDDVGSGGGSGSTTVIPDSVRRSLLDALREHLPVLGLHWLANVKDAVRLKQGEASGLWPRATTPNIGAGLTYPPGVKPSFAKLPLRGRWPAMAAAAAAELKRSGPGDTMEAAPFLLSVCVCGLVAAVDGLSRRRPEWSSRHSRFSRSSPLGSPSVDFGDFDAIGLGGDPGVGAAVGVVLQEEDEGEMAEDASLMFITALRCLFSRPELLGKPSPVCPVAQEPGNASPNGVKNDSEKLSSNGAGDVDDPTGANGSRAPRRFMGAMGVMNGVNDANDGDKKAGKADAIETCGAWGVPVPTVVQAVRTLSSPPFLRRGISTVSTGAATAAASNGSHDGGSYSLRLQLAAVSVLRVLVSGNGAEYVSRANAAMSSEDSGLKEVGEVEAQDMFQGLAEEKDFKDSGPLALWEAIVGGVVGGVQGVLPTAFGPLELVGDSGGGDHEPQHDQDSQGLSFAADFPSNVHFSPPTLIAPTTAAIATNNSVADSDGDGAHIQSLSEDSTASAATTAAAATAASMKCPGAEAAHPNNSMLLAALLPLLAHLPPVCPPAERPNALPNLLLLSVRVVGSVAGRAMTLTGPGTATSGDGPRSAYLLASLPAEVTAAVEFVRACIQEIWIHGDAKGGDVASTAAVGDSSDAIAKDDQVRESVVSPTPVEVSGDAPPVAGGEVVEMVAHRVDGDDDDDGDDWGDEDFQGADEVVEETPNTAFDSGGKVGENPLEAGEADVSEDVGATDDVAKDEIRGLTEPPSIPSKASDVSQVDVSASDTEGFAVDVQPQPQPQVSEKCEPPKNKAVTEGSEDDVGGGSANGGPTVGSGAFEGLDDVDTAKGDAAAASTSVGASAMKADLVDADGSNSIADVTAQATVAVSTTAQELSSGDTKCLDGPPQPQEEIVPHPEDNDENEHCGGEPCVRNARSLILGAGRAVNELLEEFLRQGGSIDRSRALTSGGSSATAASHGAAAIGVAAEAWGAIASVVPHEAEGMAGPLRAALSCPVDRCSVATRLALMRAVVVTVAAAVDGEEAPAGQMSTTVAAAEVLLRLLAPHALAGLRLEINRAAAAMKGGGASREDERVREACLLEGVRVSQLAFKAAPQASHGALLGVLLPLYAPALSLRLPALNAAIGQVLLHAARSSAAAFKTAVTYVGAAERQALEEAVRAAMIGRGGPAGGGGARSGGGGFRGSITTKKLDLSQYSSRG